MRRRRHSYGGIFSDGLNGLCGCHGGEWAMAHDVLSLTVTVWKLNILQRKCGVESTTIRRKFEGRRDMKLKVYGLSSLIIKRKVNSHECSLHFEGTITCSTLVSWTNMTS